MAPKFFACFRRGGVGGAKEASMNGGGSTTVPLASGEGPPVIMLAYHVEYWDHLGWKDPLASCLWSARQKALGGDSIYTPQAVVQGRSQCLATGEAAVLEEIGKAPAFPSPTMQATFQRRTP